LKNLHIYKFLFCMAILSCYMSKVLADDDSNQEQKPIAEILRKTLQKISAKGAFGKLLIAKGKDIIYNQGFGSPVQRKKIRNQFMIGCISKLFTAAAILKLVERHQLDLNDPISRYLPDDDPYWKGGPPKWAHSVTINQLLNHTSGIQEYLYIKGFEAYYEKIQTTATVMQFIAQAPLTFSPGSKYEYNSSAYLILGAMIERVSGKVYRDFIEDEFLRPLKMTDTILVHDRFLFDLFKDYPNITHGFNLENGKLMPAPDVNLSTVFSEASIITSA
jgi:CubicO group peptidase (beta-lactamase class C family)